MKLLLVEIVNYVPWIVRFGRERHVEDHIEKVRWHFDERRGH